MTPRLKATDFMDRQLVPFYIYYVVVFMGTAAMLTFLNIYFEEELGFTLAQIGTISSIGPIVTILTQPWLGVLSDRTNKRKVLMALIGGTVLVSLLFPLHYAFMFIAIVAIVNTIAGNSVPALGDAITVQFLERKKVKFNTIRMIGTISYALMAAVAGYLVGDDLTRIFYIKAIFMGIALFTVFWMPDLQRGILKKAIPGEGDELEVQPESDEKKPEAVSQLPSIKEGFRELFQNKMIMCIMLSSLVVGIPMSFYSSFLGIQLMGGNVNATEVQVGFANFLSAASEIPVLLLVNRLFGKRRPHQLLMFIGFFFTVRFLMLFVADIDGMIGSLYIIYANQLLHGLTFMVHFYFTVVLINAYTPTHIKSTAQTLNAVTRAIAAFIGAGIGGTLAGEIGIGNVHLILAIIVFSLCVILPGYFSIKYRDKVKNLKRVGEAG